MGNFPWLNLITIAILVVAVAQVSEVGLLFNALIDLFIISFSALLAVSFFSGLAKLIQNFVGVNIWTAYIVGFWMIFAVIFLLLVAVKSRIIGEEELITFEHIDKIGSILTGLTAGAVISGMLIFTACLVPLSEEIDRECRFLRRPVIFNIDRALPRLYGYFVKDPKNYNSRKFTLRYHHSYYLEEIRERKRREEEAAESEKFYGR